MHDYINILYFNARSILPKLDELSALCKANSYDVVCVVESWLDSEISDSEVNISGYRVFRYDRNRHGDGVLIFVKNQLAQDASIVLLPNVPDNLEFLPISFTFCIATFYRPPSSSALYFDSLYCALQKLNIPIFFSFVLVGDFNIDYFCTSHFLYPKLQNMLDSFCLSQVVAGPTHTSSRGNQTLIDLALLSEVSQLAECNIVPPVSNSDHLSVEIKLKAWNSRQVPIPCERQVWNYANAFFFFLS